MWLLDRLAEERIEEARRRGEFDDLPGQGRPLQLEEDNPFVPEELRTALRLLKNAGFIPPEVALRREIGSVEALLREATTREQREAASARLRLLLQRLGAERSASLQVQGLYFEALAARLDTSATTTCTTGAGTNPGNDLEEPS